MISKKLVAASSEPLVLAILSHGESYGYAILQRVRAMSGGRLAWNEGMLYPVLHRLERAGLIEARWEDGGGRKRKYYRLAAAGERALASEQEEWEVVDATLRALWEGAGA